MTGLNGKVKSSRSAPTQLRFPFTISSVGTFTSVFSDNFGFLMIASSCNAKFCLALFAVCLSDSLLAFHDHGVQGRGLRDNQITQDITEMSQTYRVLGHDK